MVSMSNPTDRVEIITSVQRRRRWTAAEKGRIVEETFEPGMMVSLVVRRHGEKTFEALTDQEWDMIETIRENREDDGFRLLIERKHGVWEIELKSAKMPNLERGTGVDFNQAWGNITETIP